ncbi:polyprenyl synthetase family protein [Antarcticibacterium arcticum]|uniref:Polyprenyl synthetase family protein n=1 Tax=Antarcticibacterium arcticum TaxID=2585771 RepID=A0A5B8YPA1_9FLAO|nr:polyprenyl synthetase family protein [Antarcticibacterium arcticum]QED38717.1 polyprenyl synthetase family protein [Antarcticibacterium arcticum]
MLSITQYREAFLEYLETAVTLKEPVNLYEPISYILHLGGKRLRPVLVLMSAEVFESSFKKALSASLAIEVFHNFSLVHDDIMDDAPLRRGKATVHERWDVNTGILSGDAMLIYSYQLLENYDGPIFKELLQLFNSTAMRVCEGQQYDVDFATQDDVEIKDYLKMIEYKTAVLVAAALQMGAIIAETTPQNKQAMYEFGRLLGIAFQLQDDYLDAFGDPETFGKQVGGDIIENKKTFLYLTALQMADAVEARQLEHLYSINPGEATAKIEAVKQIFENSGASLRAREEIKKYTNKAFEALEELDIPEDRKALLRDFGQDLMNREV